MTGSGIGETEDRKSFPIKSLAFDSTPALGLLFDHRVGHSELSHLVSLV
jgi:hypothetical protein